MNKKVLKITSIRDNDSSSYWKGKSHLKRIQALEQIRQIIFGYDPSTTRLQRVITITKLKKSKW